MWSIVTLVASRCYFEQTKCHANGRLQGLFPRSDLQLEEMDTKNEDGPHCLTGHLFQELPTLRNVTSERRKMLRSSWHG